MLSYGLALAALAVITVLVLASRRSAAKALAAARTDADACRRRLDELRASSRAWTTAVVASEGSWWEVAMPSENPTAMPREPLLSADLAAACGHDLAALATAESSWSSLVHPRDLRRLDQAARDHLEGRSDSFEALYRLHTGDGEWRWIETRGCIERDSASRPVRWSGLDWDVTEREVSGQEARDFRRMIEAMPNPLALTDAHGLIRYVNPAFTRYTGYTREEIVGQSPLILDSDETPTGTHEEAWSMMTSGHEWQGEFENRTKEGARYRTWVSISPLRDAAGEVTHALLLHQWGAEENPPDTGPLPAV